MFAHACKYVTVRPVASTSRLIHLRQREHRREDGASLQLELLEVDILRQVGLLVVVRVRARCHRVLEEGDRRDARLVEGLCSGGGGARTRRWGGKCESAAARIAGVGVLSVCVGGVVAE